MSRRLFVVRPEVLTATERGDKLKWLAARSLAGDTH